MSEAHEALLAEIAAGVALHYDSDGRDPDLDLLLGDQRYARGLARLAELGDLAATLELGDVISLIAQARAAGDPELAQAVWAAGRRAVIDGASETYEQAKKLASAGDPQALAALRQAARR
jgi:hypothetical protein